MSFKISMSVITIGLLISTVSAAQKSPGDIPASAFAKLDSYVDAQVSPNGEYLAFLYPDDDRWGVHVHTFASGDTFRIPPGEEMDYNWLRWANDETLVFSMSFTATRQFTETIETRLLAFDVGTDKMTALVKPAQVKGNANSRIALRSLPPAQLQDNVIDWMPDDPDHILLSLDDDQDAADEVRKIELATGDYETVRDSRRGIQSWIVDATGEIRFGYGYRNSEFLARLKDTEGEWTTLRKTDWYKNGWFPLGFTTDTSRIYVAGPGEHGTREIRILNILDGSFEETLFSDEQYDAAGIVEHPLTGRPSGVTFVRHRRGYQYFDREMNRFQKTLDKLFPDASNKITSLSSDKQKLVFETSSDTNPGVVYVWDLGAKTMEAFGLKNPLIEPELMRPVEAVEYQSSDGMTIPAYLTLPAGTGDAGLPTVILPHGGPAGRDDQSFWFLSQFLASRGYAVLQPNFRGSEGYGYDFEHAGRGQWGGLMQDDLSAGARWLVENHIADRDRICIVGWSYGGYAAAMGLVKSPDMFRCAASINGVYDLPKLIIDEKDYIGGRVWTDHIGLEGENARTVSPFDQAQKIQSPLLIVHAEDDGRVQVSQATEMHQRLKRNDKAVTFVRLPHGGHSLVNESARETLLENLESFLDENLGSR